MNLLPTIVEQIDYSFKLAMTVKQTEGVENSLLYEKKNGWILLYIKKGYKHKPIKDEEFQPYWF